MGKQNGLLERFQRGENVIVAEGYIFEFERRGYLRAGAFVPEVIIEHPHLVKNLYEEFVHAGSDVVLAFQYYGHREKMKLVGREADIENLNMTALRLAREVADATGTLMAGNLCNSTLYKRDDPERIKKAEAIFKEQVEWAVKGGADFIVAETYSELGEAMLALKTSLKYAKGLPVVVSFIAHTPDKTYDGVPFPEACRQLEEAGAAAVGLNCSLGPATILPIMKQIKEVCKGPLVCLPVPYKTTESKPDFWSFTDELTGENAFPVNLMAHQCSRTDITQFGLEAKALGIQYVGLCCGNASNYLRALSEAYGRVTPASRFSPNMKQHFIFGKDSGQIDYYASDLKSISLKT